MKRCPGCGTYYDRAEQEFCVVDGLPLEGEVTEDADPFIGTIVDGRYEVLSVLGRGGMGAVYMARQKSVEREIALKVIVGETSADLRNRFMLEARLTSSLKSVHTVTVFDFGVSEDMLYLAMEYLEGRSLKDMLDVVEHLPWRTCLKIVSAIAESLGEALRDRTVQDFTLYAAHPMSTCRMGRDAESSVVDSNGQAHRLPGLFLADAGVFPTSLGVNPQLTTMVVGTVLGRRMLQGRA